MNVAIDNTCDPSKVNAMAVVRALLSKTLGVDPNTIRALEQDVSLDPDAVTMTTTETQLSYTQVCDKVKLLKARRDAATKRSAELNAYVVAAQEEAACALRAVEVIQEDFDLAEKQLQHHMSNQGVATPTTPAPTSAEEQLKLAVDGLVKIRKALVDEPLTSDYQVYLDAHPDGQEGFLSPSAWMVTSLRNHLDPFIAQLSGASVPSPSSTIYVGSPAESVHSFSPVEATQDLDPAGAAAASSTRTLPKKEEQLPGCRPDGKERSPHRKDKKDKADKDRAAGGK